MNRPLLSLILIVIFSTGLFWAANAIAHQGNMASDSYVGDDRHHVLVPGSGGCVRTGSWTPSQRAAGCGSTITLQAGALFDFNQAVIKSKGRAELNALAASLKSANDVRRIDVVGHTDSMGPDSYNMDLSMRRANAVKSYLVKKGVSSNIIFASGKGESRPVASNDTAKGRAMNRRVEIDLGHRSMSE